MAERWVVNASPLIVLSKINHQLLLTELTEEIVVPQAVIAEINVGPADDPARRFLSASPLPMVSVPSDLAILTWDLGAGETVVLSHALANPGWKAVVDDGLARRCARALAIAEMAGLQIEHERRLSTAENRLDRAAAVVGELGRRVDKLELRLVNRLPMKVVKRFLAQVRREFTDLLCQ